VTAQYALNANGTVAVVNTATVGPQPISIEGTATPVDPAYATTGAFKVAFPGTPEGRCPGPNYIVQGMLQGEDVSWKEYRLTMLVE
jgi:apolipoprotein D and lipocalin family protein